MYQYTGVGSLVRLVCLICLKCITFITISLQLQSNENIYLHFMNILMSIWMEYRNTVSYWDMFGSNTQYYFYWTSLNCSLLDKSTFTTLLYLVIYIYIYVRMVKAVMMKVMVGEVILLKLMMLIQIILMKIVMKSLQMIEMYYKNV